MDGKPKFLKEEELINLMCEMEIKYKGTVIIYVDMNLDIEKTERIRKFIK